MELKALKLTDVEIQVVHAALQAHTAMLIHASSLYEGERQKSVNTLHLIRNIQNHVTTLMELEVE